ncbi:MAG: hypothetical protein IPP41_02555 [Rhodocyclaceae bacterium]|nr:hypothetical protein [Rhodocyclaceae bacterium]
MRLIRIVTALCLVMLLLNGQHGAFAHALEHLPPSVGLHQGDDITAPQATPDDDSVCLTCVAYAAIGVSVILCEANCVVLRRFIFKVIRVGNPSISIALRATCVLLKIASRRRLLCGAFSLLWRTSCFDFKTRGCVPR